MKRKHRLIPEVPLDEIRIVLRALDMAKDHETAQGEFVTEDDWNAAIQVEAWADEVARRRA